MMNDAAERADLTDLDDWIFAGQDYEVSQR